MRDLLYLDIETYCELDLPSVGVHAYASHPSFEILLVGYALNDQPVAVLDGQTFFGNDWLTEILFDKRITKVAHNATFEHTCFRTIVDTPISEWECTQIMCAQLGLPRALEKAGEVLGTSLKDTGGKQLIKLFSKPQKNGRATAANMPEKWQEFIEYNRQDVEVEREIYKKLSSFGMQEKKLFVIDNTINNRGVRVDVRLAKNAVQLAEGAYATAYERLMAVTGLDVPSDSAIKKKYGLSTLAKKEIKGLVKERPELGEILDLRGILAKTSLKKYETMQTCVCPDGRARGLTAFYGAGRTGRWAGRLIQLQNLPQINLDDEVIQTARTAVLRGDSRLFDILYDDDRIDILSKLIRTSLVPRDGHKFIVADFSAIEARVLAWVSNERWRLDVFNGDGRIYETSAERMFNLVSGSVTKGSPYRQKGKIAELALGYGGGVGALTTMGALDMGLDEAELPKLVRMWRNANPAVTSFWYTLDTMLKECLLNYPPVTKHPYVSVTKEHKVLQIKLPSGRRLTYQDARWSNEGRIAEARYVGMNQTTNKWELQDLYGAKATENVVQAIARDCLAEVLIYAEEKGYNPVFHVHDEIICEVPEVNAMAAYEDIMARMATPPVWAQGLPIKGDGFICDYYNK
jgi:DNA polymerase